MSVIFVTGTDTGVGKTLVSKVLIDYFVENGQQVSAMKPVAAGAKMTAAGLRNEDAEILMQSMNTQFTYSQVNPYVFEQPIAPHIAAAKANCTIDIHKLDAAYEILYAGSEQLVIEGAGGWQVPLNHDVSFADWVADKKWPVVLVVGFRLGCINHALLTYLDILQKGCPLLGWVANVVDANMQCVNDVVDYLKGHITAPLLGTIPYLSEVDRQDVNKYLALTSITLRE